MGQILRVIGCGLLLACVFITPPLRAADQLNVLIVGDETARGTPLFARTRTAINEALMHEGFAVFDDDAFDTLKQKRADSERIAAVRALPQPIDALVIFSVQANAHQLTYTTDLSAHVSGRVINARTGQSLGSFQVASPDSWKVPSTCADACLIDTLGKQIDIIGGNLGAALGEKVGVIVPLATPAPKSIERLESVGVPAPAHIPALPARPKDYTLIFTGFAADERADLSSYLHAFPGYRHETVSATAADAVTYTYDSASDAAHLDHSLHMMLDRIGADGSVTFAADAKTFTVRKTGR